MEKKKILFVVHQLNCGGVQKSLITALNHIDYNKNDVTLYIRKNRVDLLERVNKNVNVIINTDKNNYYHTFIGFIYTALITFFSFSKKYKSHFEAKLRDYIVNRQMQYEAKTYFSGKSYDIAISYIQGYTSQFVAEKIKAEKKIVFFHGSEDEHHLIHIRIFADFDLILGVSSDVADLLKKFYPDYTEKISYLSNYVNYEEVISEANIFTLDLVGKLTLCTCGRFTEVKGFDIATKTAKILKEINLDYIWYYVGDGPERVNIENLINTYGLKDNIIMTGMQENPYPYIKCCDIYVQPSLAEAQPLSIIEAQILNKPVVTTKTVGGMNIVKDGITGIQTEINPEALAEGIMKLTDSTLRERMVAELSKIDYNKEKERYTRQWTKLLNNAEMY